VTVVLHVSDGFVEVTVSFETKAVCAVVRGVGNARSLRSRKLYRLPNQIRYDVVVENKLWRKTSAAFKPICRFTLCEIRNGHNSFHQGSTAIYYLLGGSSKVTKGFDGIVNSTGFVHEQGAPEL
jgi:hypothetical protein